MSALLIVPYLCSTPWSVHANEYFLGDGRTIPLNFVPNPDKIFIPTRIFVDTIFFDTMASESKW